MKQLLSAFVAVAILAAAPVVWRTTQNRNASTADLTAQTQGTAIASGNFVPVEHPTQGRATVVQEGNRYFIEFSQDFKTDPGPALRVILHRQNNVTLSINEGDYVVLEKLQKTRGTQRYAVPSNVDVTKFGSVAVWCQQFNATFGFAAI